MALIRRQISLPAMSTEESLWTNTFCFSACGNQRNSTDLRASILPVQSNKNLIQKICGLGLIEHVLGRNEMPCEGIRCSWILYAYKKASAIRYNFITSAVLIKMNATVDLISEGTGAAVATPLSKPPIKLIKRQI